MNKVALKTIGFKTQNEVNDQWVQQEAHVERSGITTEYLDGIRRFGSFDQGQATLTEKSAITEQGKVCDLELSFVVRTEDDIALGKKYLHRPLVLHAWAVDDAHYIIGTKSYPAYLESDNTYNGTSTRELAFVVKYQSRTPVLA